MSVARIASTILALLLGVFSAKYFGATASKDCYLVAQTIPSLVTMLLAGGVYTSLLVTLAEVGRREGVAGQIAFARRAAWHVSLALTPLVLVAVLLPRQVVHLLAPGFGAERLDLSARLLPLTAVTALISLLLIFVRCVFQTRSQFIIPSFVYTVIPLVSLIGLVALVDRAGIFALAIAPLLGNTLAVVLLACLVRPFLRDSGEFVPEPGTPADHASWQRTFWYALLPMSLGANFGHINLLVDNAFASYLPAGEITLLGFAFVIVSNTELLTTLSLAEVVFPRLASAALLGPQALAETLQWSLRHMILLTTPLGAGALVFGQPLVRLLFERGEFGPDSTRGVAGVLACYSLEFIFMGYLVVFSRVLFATKKFALVAWTSSAAILANAVLDYWLMQYYGVNGIASATTLVALVHALILAFLVRREVSAIRWPGDSLFVGRVLASAAIMSGLVLGWSYVFERSIDISLESARLVEVLGGLSLGGLAYVASLHLLRIEEARSILRRLLHSFAALEP